MISPRTEFFSLHNRYTRSISFKDLVLDIQCGHIDWKDLCQFLHEVHKRDDLLRCRGESNVFYLSCTQTDLGLELAGPNHWASSI
eukprot:8240771-Ditylum_brightwellii.AAC.1